MLNDMYPLFFGCATIGSEISESDSFELLDCFWEAGGRAFDTAHIYASWLENGEERSESCLGAWLKERQYGEQAYILTKGGHPRLSDNEPTLNQENLNIHIHESLQRLQLDHIDCYMLHRDNERYSVEEILSWCEALKNQGKCSSYACSNWPLNRLKEATKIAKKNGWQGFSASSIGYSLADANPGEGAADTVVYMDNTIHAFHSSTQLAQIPFSSQAVGFFRKEHLPESGTDRDCIKANVQRAYFNDTNFARLRLCCTLSEVHNCSPNQIAVAYLLHQDFPCFPIIGGRTTSQVIDSCQATTIKLTADEIQSLKDPVSTDDL